MRTCVVKANDDDRDDDKKQSSTGVFGCVTGTSRARREGRAAVGSRRTAGRRIAERRSWRRGARGQKPSETMRGEVLSLQRGRHWREATKSSVANSLERRRSRHRASGARSPRPGRVSPTESGARARVMGRAATCDASRSDRRRHEKEDRRPRRPRQRWNDNTNDATRARHRGGGPASRRSRQLLRAPNSTTPTA